MTGRISIDLFTTLDGVAQGPGGPGEDTSDGFAFSGWQAPLFDDVVGQSVLDHLSTIDALILGRRTYDIWADYWPVQSDENPIAHAFNRIPKFVASRSNPPLAWSSSERIGRDLVGEVQGIRERYHDIHVIGSIDLAQTLFAEKLFDELRLWVYPVVLGQGKKVFPDGATPANLRLLADPVAGPSGAVLLRYAPADGVPATGDMTARD